MTETTIDKTQAATWAQETTLKSLVKQSGDGNKLLGIIAKAVDKTTDKSEIDKYAKLTAAIEKETTAVSNKTKADRTVEDATRELQTAFSQSSNSFKSLLRSDPTSLFGNLGGYFKDFQYELAAIGSPMAKLAGTAAMVAEVFQVIWTRGTEMADAVFDMYDAGLVFSGGISQLADDAAATGLDLQTLSKVLTKHGQVVATMGIARTAQLGKAFNLATQGGTALGMTFEQAQDTLLSYAEQEKMTGQLRNRSDEDIIAGAKEYGSQLNRLSQVTGQRREQIDQEIKQNLKRPDVNVLLSTLNDSLRDSAKQGLSELQVMGPEMAGTFQDMIIAAKTGGLPAMLATNENMTQMLSQSGQMNNFMSLVDATVHGNKDAMDGLIEQIGAGTGAYAKQNSFFLKLGGMQGDMVNLASGIQVQSRNISQRNQDLLNNQPAPEDATRLKEAQQEITSSFNALNVAFSKLSAKLVAPLAKPFAMLISGLTGLATVAIKVVDALGYLLYPLDKIGDFFSYLADLGKEFLGSYGGQGSVGATVLDIGALAGTVGTVLLGGGLLKKIFMSPTVLGMFTGPWMTKIMGGAMNLFKRIPGMGMFSRIGSLGAGGTGGMGKLVDGLKSAAGAGKASSSIGKAFSGLTKGVADGIKYVLTAIADGIKAFGSTDVMKGIISLGLLSGSMYIAGKAFQEFSKVNWEDMGKAGAAMIAIGGAAAIAGRDAVMIGAGGVALGAAIGAIGLGMIAAGDGIEKFQNLSWEAMGKAGTAIVALGAASALAGLASPLIIAGGAALGIAIASIGGGIAGATWIMGAAMPKLAEGLKAFTDIDGDKLEKTGMGMIKIGGGLIAMGVGEVANVWGSLASGISSFFGTDPITKLSRFGEIAEPLQKAADAMAAFAAAYPQSIDAINNTVIDPTAMANFEKLSAAASPGIFGSLFGSSTPAPAPAAPATPGTKVTHTTPDQKHQQMMDMLSQLNDTMTALLNTEDRQTRVMSDGFSAIGGVIH